MPTWQQWVKANDWRRIAEDSTPDTYVPIYKTLNGRDYEVARVSRFSQQHDGDTPHIDTSIRDFNSRTVLHSTATRDLCLTRFITHKGRPVFVFEPGADVVEWRAAQEGVSVPQLIRIMRTGDLARRVRRRDRQALKNSQEQTAAVSAELNQELAEVRAREQDLLAKIAATELEKTEAIRDRNRMRDNLIKQNQSKSQDIPPSSGPLACPIDAARKNGYKLTSTKPLPGNFEG